MIGSEHHRYGVYGVAIRSNLRLGLPEYSHDGFAEVECVSGSASDFAAVVRGARFDSPPGSWYRYAFLADGSTYVQWDTVGEFLVSADGRRVTCRPDDEASDESFQVYLLGQALSFALVRQGVEPLHATAVVIDGAAVAFLGGNCFGKSTLAASFVGAGYPQLTDDMLVVRIAADRVVAYPGPPRTKLFSKVANRLVLSPPVAPHMNGGTDKRILPLEQQSSCASAVELRAMYSLVSPRDACRATGVGIEPLSRRDAFVALVKATFNRRLVGQARMARQFIAMVTLAERVPVKTLRYPRVLDRLPEVRAAVLADLDRTVN